MSSSFRLMLLPDFGPTREIKLPLKTTTLRGAQRHAREYQGDVGVSGLIAVQTLAAAETWRTVRIATVKNSEITKWEPMR